MDLEEAKELLGDELCDFCPWKNGEIDHGVILCVRVLIVKKPMSILWMKMSNSLIVMSEEIRHCSDCEYFWSNPQCAQMYCCKLQKKITARKKPCKYYKNYYTKDGNECDKKD